MCGRYARTLSRTDIELEFRLEVVAESYDPEPNWNVAPTQDVPIVVGRMALPTDTWLHDAASSAAAVHALKTGLLGAHRPMGAL